MLMCFRFIKGFMTRYQPACIDNSEYLAHVRHSYLTRLKENLPTNVLKKDSWLTAPPVMHEVGDNLVMALTCKSDFQKLMQNYIYI